MPNIGDEAEQAGPKTFAELWGDLDPNVPVDLVDEAMDLLGVIEPPIPCCADKHQCSE